jgi:hypothetical protein
MIDELDEWLDAHEACYDDIWEDEEGYYIYVDKPSDHLYIPSKFNHEVFNRKIQ